MDATEVGPSLLPACKATRLASDAARQVLAGIGLATSDGDARPSPVGARAAAADNSLVVSTTRDGTGAGDAGQLEVGDGDAGGGAALEVTAIVVLLDEDTVPARVSATRSNAV